YPPAFGPRYAFTVTVDARSYSRNSGRIACDTETGSPDEHNARATAISFSGLAKENRRHTAMASAPLALTFSTSSRSSWSWGLLNTVPSEAVRSAIPKRISAGTMQAGGVANQSYR